MKAMILQVIILVNIYIIFKALKFDIQNTEYSKHTSIVSKSNSHQMF